MLSCMQLRLRQTSFPKEFGDAPANYHLQPFLALGEEFIAPVTYSGMPG